MQHGRMAANKHALICSSRLREFKAAGESRPQPKTFSTCRVAYCSVLVDNHTDIDAWVKSEVSDVFDGGGWAVDIDVSLVYAHFKVVPSVGSISARGSSCSDGKSFGWHADWSFDNECAFLGSFHDSGADSIKSFMVSSTNSHSASIGLFLDLNVLSLVFLSVHFQISEATSLINNKPNQS